MSDVLLCFCHFPVLCPGSGVVLDFIDFWSMPPYLLTLYLHNLKNSQEGLSPRKRSFNLSQVPLILFFWPPFYFSYSLQIVLPPAILPSRAPTKGFFSSSLSKPTGAQWIMTTDLVRWNSANLSHQSSCIHFDNWHANVANQRSQRRFIWVTSETMANHMARVAVSVVNMRIWYIHHFIHGA